MLDGSQLHQLLIRARHRAHPAIPIIFKRMSWLASSSSKISAAGVWVPALSLRGHEEGRMDDRLVSKVRGQGATETEEPN